MSKSRPGLVVGLMEAMELYGADAIRVSELFAGPVEADIDWEDVSVDGNKKWLARVWRVVLDNADRIRDAGPATGDSALRRTTHQKIAAVTESYERFAFNLAIARMHELTNELVDVKTQSDEDVREAIDALLVMLSPIAAFMTEELWQRLGRAGSVHRQAWPRADAALTSFETTTMIVQVGGKVRDKIDVPSGIGENEMKELALASEKVRAHLEDRTVVKEIVVPPKLVNFVVR